MEDNNPTPSTANWYENGSNLNCVLGIAIKVVALFILLLMAVHVTDSVVNRGRLFYIGGASMNVDFPRSLGVNFPSGLNVTGVKFPSSLDVRGVDFPSRLNVELCNKSRDFQSVPFLIREVK